MPRIRSVSPSSCLQWSAMTVSIAPARQDKRDAGVWFHIAKPMVWRRGLDRLRYAFARHRQHLARKNAGGVQHLGLHEIAERKLANEVIGAGLLRHLPHLLADRAGRTCNAAAVLHHGVEILGDAGIARLGAVLVPELHKAFEKHRPGAAAEFYRI